MTNLWLYGTIPLEMGDLPPDTSSQTLHSPSAFIFYRPSQKTAKETVFYNQEAWRVLTFANPAIKEKTDCTHEIISLCAKWKDLLDEKVRNLSPSEAIRPEQGVYIDIMQSYRRRYAIRGILLSNQLLTPEKHEYQYLFILERVSPDNVNLPMIFRQRNLTNREQEIVKLLIAGRSNKEIADALGLSLNTVKGYLKLLMRKLGVQSRAAIVAVLLTGK